MQIILSDHNCEGQASAIFDVLHHDGTWLALVPMELKWFKHVALPATADDETVWRLCQEQGYILLTGNRRTDDQDKSLEFTIRRLVNPNSLPVLTIGNLKRVMADLAYRRRCAFRLAEIVYDLQDHRGITRLYIP